MRDFISFCRTHKIAVRKELIAATEREINRKFLLREEKIFINRKIPYLPSFRRIAAKIIEPSRGASTWALGNQRWKINNGSFTKKAIIKNVEEIKEGEKGRRERKERRNKDFLNKRRRINNGSEATIVYIII